MEEKIKVLILEDLSSDVELAERELKTVLNNYKIVVADTEQGFIKALENFKPDLVISDYLLPAFTGMKALQITRKKKEFIPFIILTGSMNEETAVECMKAGADDYVIKEHIKRLGSVILGALDKKKTRQERKQAVEQLREAERVASSTLNSLSAHIAILDADGIILAVNQAWRRFAETNGPIRGNVCEGANYLDVCYVAQGDDQSIARHFAAGIRRVLSGEAQEFAMEYPCHSPSEQRWFIERVTRFAGEGPVHVVISHESITERKQAEETLANNLSLLESTMQSTTDGILVIDSQQKVTFYNDRFLDLWNIPKELADKNDDNLLLDSVLSQLKNPDEFIEKVKFLYSHPDEESFDFIRFTNGRIFERYSQPQKVMDEIVGRVWSFRDITKRKQAEEELKASEERFELAMKASNDGLFDWDLLTNEIYYSPAWKKMIGYEDHELPNDFSVWEKTTAPEDVKKSWELQQKLISKQIDRFVIEFKMKHKNGHWVDILSRARAIFNDEGKAIRMIGTHTNITERKQAEAELLKLSTAVTQSPSVITITDTDGNIQYVNPKFNKITGYSREEVIGQNHRILQSGEHSAEMYKALWETISSGNTWQGEFHNKKKNGELYWEMASISPILDEKGKIINYLKDSEDITDRKQAEDNFRNSIDESPLGIRIVNQAGKTIYVNKALLGIYEFSSLDEFNNTKAIDRYTEKSYKEHQERKKIRQAGGDASEYEISIRRKNGEIRHIKVWRKEVIWNREKHFQVINQDITELKLLNTDLILAKEKAEESNRLKSAFLNNMSHEIRTPLNGITGFIGLLQNAEIDDKQKQEFFDIINSSSNRLIATVTDIIDISRIEAGEVKVAKSEVSANEILEEQYGFFYHEAKAKGLELTYIPTLSEKEAHIVTDRHKLEGILINLIKNAIKYTKQGSIMLGCSHKKEKDSNVLEFYVKDTGIGIPANRTEAIFNRFEQADIGDTRAFEGSGLGLAISKSYVEMLGGKIYVTSKEGSGSTFFFSIPFTNQNVNLEGTKKLQNKEQQTSLSNLNVIVAEDDETSIMLFEIIFKNVFKNITYTTSGQKALEKCRENPGTDIVLIDVKLPDINGYDVTREIRKFNRDVIIIAQTAFGLTGDRKKAIKAGCDDYITKPLNKKELFEKIRVCLDKH